MVKSLSIIALATLIISSCATTANYTEVVDSWDGANIDKLVMSWGPPANIYEMSDGRKLYTYHNTQTSYITTEYSTVPVEYWCKTTFTVDRNNTIVHWKWEGNSCRSTKK